MYLLVVRTILTQRTVIFGYLKYRFPRSMIVSFWEENHKLFSRKFQEKTWFYLIDFVICF